jgi:predicted nuclease of predicted toxin-antitoxin system
MTKVRFQADADPEVLAIAAQDGRVLVTHDRKTMPAEFAQFIMSQTSSGVLIISQNLPISSAIDALILVWEASTAEEWINQIMSLPF